MHISRFLITLRRSQQQKTTTTRSRHRNGSHAFSGFAPRKRRSSPLPPTKLDLARMGARMGGRGGGRNRTAFGKGDLSFFVLYGKMGFRVGFGHAGVEKVTVLSVKMALNKRGVLGADRFVCLGQQQNNKGTSNDEHDDDNEPKMSIQINIVVSTSPG